MKVCSGFSFSREEKGRREGRGGRREVEGKGRGEGGGTRGSEFSI